MGETHSTGSVIINKVGRAAGIETSRVVREGILTTKVGARTSRVAKAVGRISKGTNKVIRVAGTKTDSRSRTPKEVGVLTSKVVGIKTSSGTAREVGTNKVVTIVEAVGESSIS